ncbi:MAG: lipid A biosynthesis acyltransferase, partial [Candidatus Zapsychrus exili]|nr:lipid A biosynthesis acyltransferase [Candidatus Zapsychrus exili]
GPAVLACKTGSPIIPAFLIRQKDNTFKLFISDPIYSPQTSNELVEQDMIVSVIREYIRVIEKKIREYPTQWLMFREFPVK